MNRAAENTEYKISDGDAVCQELQIWQKLRRMIPSCWVCDNDDFVAHSVEVGGRPISECKFGLRPAVMLVS